jgi:hypothetical protein
MYVRLGHHQLLCKAFSFIALKLNDLTIKSNGISLEANREFIELWIYKCAEVNSPTSDSFYP